MFEQKIVFMGSADISREYLRSLFENKYNIIAVYTQPPRKKNRGMEVTKSPVQLYAEDNNIRIHHPNNLQLPDDLSALKDLKPDIVVVMGYGILIPSILLNIPKFGFINIHVSLLPRWRGASPIEHSIINGDKETGISIFQLEEKLDTGPILNSASIKIEDSFSKHDLILRLNKLGTSLLNETLPKIFNKTVLMKEQDDSKATYAKKLTSESRKINFNDNVTNVYNHIRAFSPKPSAWFMHNNQRINILKCSMDICKSESSKILNAKFHIGCKNGKIIPQIIQREGKKTMKINEFLKGYKFEVNQKINA